MFARKFVKGVKVKVGDSEFSLDMAARQCCKRSWKCEMALQPDFHIFSCYLRMSAA